MRWKSHDQGSDLRPCLHQGAGPRQPAHEAARGRERPWIRGLRRVHRRRVRREPQQARPEQDARRRQGPQGGQDTRDQDRQARPFHGEPRGDHTGPREVGSRPRAARPAHRHVLPAGTPRRDHPRGDGGVREGADTRQDARRACEGAQGGEDSREARGALLQGAEAAHQADAQGRPRHIGQGDGEADARNVRADLPQASQGDGRGGREKGRQGASCGR